MPALTLKDQDKIAWGWVENTVPTDITFDHILSAYRLRQNFCKTKTCKRNCRGNPFCLSGLGEARLADNVNNSSKDTNNTLQRRAVGSFVGLKNLGATCYVNSLLQLWFHNKAFRDAILLWNPLEDPVEQNNPTLYSDELFAPQTVVGHLQQLFALMCYSKCYYIDPTPLVESLRLDTSTQQDAQEFSKLFISLLESALRHQCLPNVQNLINNNFSGEYCYVTRCCECQTESVSPSMFYELDLNVKGHNTLNECLSEFLQQEMLEGADCYSCTVCQTKQKAVRFIKLRSLPPVLNLQLLRFVYDREKGQKKKLKTVIQFPEVLDMKEFFETDKPSLIYNLSAVLIHKGTRASSGHFIAYIKDSVTGTWNTFNDECVEKLEGKKLKLDEEDPENNKKQKLPRLPKGVQGSTDAYMLVYTVDECKPDQTEVKLPARLQSYVDSKNKDFDTFCEEIESSKKQGQEKKEALLRLYKCLPVEKEEVLDEIDIVATDWLVSWLEDKDNKQIDNLKLLCPHEKLDPCAVTHAKYISSCMAEVLFDEFSGGPRLRVSEAMCADCVENFCTILRVKAKTLEESKEITNLLKKRMGVDEPGYYVDKYCIKTWRTKVLNIYESRHSSSRKMSNRLALSANDDLTEAINEDSSPTPTPQESKCSQSSNPADESDDVKKEITSTEVKNEEEEGNKTDDDSEMDKGFNEAILCPHGNLSIEETDRKLVPVRVWEIFKQYFPSAPSFSSQTQPCALCQNLASRDEIVKQQYYDTAVNQKRILLDLFHLRNRPVVGRTGETLYIISREHFHQQWCSFLKSMTRTEGRRLVEPPASLKVDGLLCVHGLLHFSPGYDEDLARIVLVTRQEWDTLTSLYTTDHQVTVKPDYSTDPELCQDCFAARIESEQKEKLNYERAKLNIRLVPSSTSLDDESSKSCSAEAANSSDGPLKKKPRLDGALSPVPPELKQKAVKASAPPGDVRRSSRQRKAPGQKDVQFTVSSSLTLRELKQKITSQLAVAPFDQHLRTMDGKELDGDYKTLSSFGILPNSTLLLQIDEPKESFDDVMEECCTTTEPEAGFKGTGLLQAY